MPKRAGQADNGVERGAQLVAHAGHELRLVLARQFELTALLLDFLEQAGILDRQHRLGGERTQEVDGVLGKFAGCLAPDHERAHDFVEAQQRDEQPRAISRVQHQLIGGDGRLGLHVGDLHRLALLGGLGDGPGDVDVVVLERGNQVVAHAVVGLQLEFLLRLVVHVDRSTVGIGQLNRLGNDGREHRLQVERRIDRLRDLAEGAQLLHRLPELVRPGAQLCE